MSYLGRVVLRQETRKGSSAETMPAGTVLLVFGRRVDRDTGEAFLLVATSRYYAPRFQIPEAAAVKHWMKV
jgi:hypothetical protein